MQVIETGGITLHVRRDGNLDGMPVVFSNSLGTDLRLWDALLPLLPNGLRLIRYDMRGHGLSACPAGPYTMDRLCADAEGLIDALGCGPVIFVGLSIGGMIGQALAAKRPDLVCALVLSNSAAKMGTPEMWQDRIAAIRRDGIVAIETAILDRWFGPVFRADPAAALWGAMLSRTPQEGYLGCCAAIAETDLSETTARLRLPALAISGSHDGSSPPEIVGATAALIPGTPCHTIEGTGHLPCVENPAAFAAILSPFLKDHADV